MLKLLSGNEAAALGALSAGAKVISGYPGTPSSDFIGSLWNRDLPGTRVEWSVNEKVAFEVAAGAALMGHRAVCTMKMSGVNVAFDSLIGIAYSGCLGALVIYVADDPGVTAGMCEQDSRGFAVLSDLPVLEPADAQESYDLTRFAFELSEKTGTPVFVRSVTNVAEARGAAQVGERTPPKSGIPLPKKDIARFTKAGSAICQTQHRDLIKRLAEAEGILREAGLYRLKLSGKPGGLGVVSAGVANRYAQEALEALKALGLLTEEVSTLRLSATLPYPAEEFQKLLAHCGTILVAEELEPWLEQALCREAYRQRSAARILGKLDGPFGRVGEYDGGLVLRGLCAALDIPVPPEYRIPPTQAEGAAAARPITFCAGCPHRGVYMALNRAVKSLGYKKEEVVVTGDIGCTILGMSPPFESLWTELSMGASIPLAQGIVYTGGPKPVIATLGDSTFFHAGIPGLVNAIQHDVNLTVVVLDNGWTAMTGMQVNPGTVKTMQRDKSRRIDLEPVIRGLGVDDLTVVDPYDHAATLEALRKAIPQPGVKVVLARRECAIQARRRKVPGVPLRVNAEKCTRCKACVLLTGCPAISLGESRILIDPAQCNGCGLCRQVCPHEAIERGA